MKKTNLLIIGLILTLFIGCNSSSSSPDKNDGGSASGTCPSGTECDDTPQATTACVTDGNTVVVPNEGTCKDNGHTLTCNLGTVRYDNSVEGTTLEINGRTYSCE